MSEFKKCNFLELNYEYIILSKNTKNRINIYLLFYYLLKKRIKS